MKKSTILFVFSVALGIALTLSAGNSTFAEDPSSRMGKKIRESTVEGYQFDYRLFDFKERMTQHIMVYITSPDGRSIEKAKVGFLVEGPGGSKQKKMAMGMKGAYGADLNLGAKGTYIIKMKAVAEGKKLLDKFTYEVK
jgi:hypothetical protein